MCAGIVPTEQLACRPGQLASCPSVVLPLTQPVKGAGAGWFFSLVLEQLCWRLQLHPQNEGNLLHL